MRHFSVKKRIFNCSIVFMWKPFVHECSANFRSLFAHSLMFFLSQLPEIAKFSLKIVIFVILNTCLHFFLKILVGGGGNFHISADFHEYTFKMTPYHVTEAINGYF